VLDSFDKESSSFLLINTYSGDIVFDSREYRFERILGKSFLPMKEAFFIMAIERNVRILALISLNGKGLIWKREIPIESKKFLADKNYYHPRVTPYGNLLFSYIDQFFKLDGESGEVLWKKKYPAIREITFNDGAKNVFYGKAGMDDSFNAFSLETGDPLWFDILPKKLGNVFKKKDKKEASKIKAAGVLHASLNNSKNLEVLKNSKYIIHQESQLFSINGKGFNYFDILNGFTSHTKRRIHESLGDD